EVCGVISRGGDRAAGCFGEILKNGISGEGPNSRRDDEQEKGGKQGGEDPESPAPIPSGSVVSTGRRFRWRGTGCRRRRHKAWSPLRPEMLETSSAKVSRGKSVWIPVNGFYSNCKSAPVEFGGRRPDRTRHSPCSCVPAQESGSLPLPFMEAFEC